MTITPQFLEEIRTRLPCSELIGRRVRLVRKGREYSGLCPFHNEKTPSFTVNDDKAFFHCFGCGAHGDVIGFTMQIDNLTFPEAVEKLAGEAGLEMPRLTAQDRARAQIQKSLHEVVEIACAWFEAQLRAPVGKVGLNYLYSRGLDDSTISRFRLGYAPDNREALKAALKAEGIDETLMLEAGLITKPEGIRGSFDFFRGRVIFPIMDTRGRPIAFGGRIIGDGQPKYLNSRDTPLFDKGRTLYALDKARPAVLGGPGRVPADLIIVEGYMDVIALHKAGFEGAVAPLGTALTENQIEILWKIANEPLLCFDGDQAGERAANRAANRALPLLQPGRSFRFIFLPKGDDPDSFVRRAGALAFRELLAKARPMFEVVWDSVAGNAAIDTPERRAGLEHKFEEIVRLIAERGVQAQYRRHYKSKLWSVFFSEITGRRVTKTYSTVRAPGDLSYAEFHNQRLLIAAILNNFDLYGEVIEELLKLDLGKPEYNRIPREMVEAFARQPPDLDRDSLVRELTNRHVALDEFLDPQLELLGPYARPGVPFDEALKMWRLTYRGLQLRAYNQELEQAKSQHAKSPSAESIQRIEQIIAVIQAIQQEADTQEYLAFCPLIDLAA